MLGTLRRRLFGLSEKEVLFTRRGFMFWDKAIKDHLETSAATFLRGYHKALEEPRPEPLARSLAEIELDRMGFAYEGASMALALLDAMTPWNKTRFVRFLAGPGDAHTYMAHVGFGWALARFKLGFDKRLNSLDPVLKWLALDGYGFHEGFFDWRRCYEQRERPPQLKGYALKAFDQGLGRCLWFVKSAMVPAMVASLKGFPAERHDDLWAGLGLACTYAGGVPKETVEQLKKMAGTQAPWLAQGSAFAAKARIRAGNTVPHTETACKVLCGHTMQEAAAVTDRAKKELEASGTEPAYEVWRQRIHQFYSC